MTETEFPTRRAFLTGSTGAVAVAALAACSGGSDGSNGGGGESAVQIKSGATLTQASAVPVDGALAVTVDGNHILVTQPKEGQFAAFSAICTHQRCVVAPGDGELACPCHPARFDLATGEVLGGPAPSALPAIKVKVSEGTIIVA